METLQVMAYIAVQLKPLVQRKLMVQKAHLLSKERAQALAKFLHSSKLRVF